MVPKPPEGLHRSCAIAEPGYSALIADHVRFVMGRGAAIAYLIEQPSGRSCRAAAVEAVNGFSKLPRQSSRTIKSLVSSLWGAAGAIVTIGNDGSMSGSALCPRRTTDCVTG